MNLITLLVVGSLVGWLASIIMRTDSREGLIRNVATAIGGAFVGSWLLGKLFEPTNPTGFSFGTMVASILGAAVLLYVVSRLRRAD